MALVKCPNCNKEISDKAKSCFYCGYIMNDNENDIADKENLDENEVGDSINIDSSQEISESVPKTHIDEKLSVVQGDEHKNVTMANTGNEGRKIAVIAIAGIIGFFILLFIIVIIAVSVQARWEISFDKEEAIEFSVDGLICYVPNDWEDFSDEDAKIYAYYDEKGNNDAYLCVYPFKLAVGEDFNDLKDVAEDKFELEGEFSSVDINGCEKAIFLEEYNVATSEHRLFYIIQCEQTCFIIALMGKDGYYVENEFVEMLQAIEFEDFGSVKECDSLGCSNEAEEDFRYCNEHLCSEDGCSKVKLNDSEYCAEHSLEGTKNVKTYEGCDVPDYNDFMGVELLREKDGGSAGLSGAYIIEYDKKYVYDISKEEREKLDTYLDAIKSVGYKEGKYEDGSWWVFNNGDNHSLSYEKIVVNCNENDGKYILEILLGE